jgi:hypothetical protein
MGQANTRSGRFRPATALHLANVKEGQTTIIVGAQHLRFSASVWWRRATCAPKPVALSVDKFCVLAQGNR